MKKSNPLTEKSYSFSIRIIWAYQYLSKKHNEYVISKQILRSGTSIGANAEEAQGAQSKKDFIAKIQISLKEARETHYWLRLLKETDYLEAKLADSLLEDCEEILKILTSILKSSKNNL